MYGAFGCLVGVDEPAGNVPLAQRRFPGAPAQQQPADVHDQHGNTRLGIVVIDEAARRAGWSQSTVLIGDWRQGCAVMRAKHPSHISAKLLGRNLDNLAGFHAFRQIPGVGHQRSAVVDLVFSFFGS
jgi:hypothetical protein